MSQLQYHHEEPRASKESKINLATRVATFASLAVTIIVLQTNRANVKTIDGGEFKLTYDNYFDTYKYVFYVSIIGLFYTLLLIPFAVYYLRAKKRLIDSYILLQLEFYGDKVNRTPINNTNNEIIV
ncbi:hypothetical protein ACH5RR_036584 [Cinchona calisaya]|uniref:CASP-like protein n=1 Tax=Cinchona calisaya TaxID=153742 RepID=A0ABD2Y8J5_9GENT